ncbi:GGDEF domain-containing protein [Silanimonas lenta]|uniref:GGDEF domain-containing protein n=1 Tax=Silanimonas lenta TaxID=265429 RepID=UPI002FDFD5A6
MTRLLAGLRRRARADFRLGLYLVFGLLAVLVLAPLGLVRLLQGNLPLALIDFGVSLVILAAMAHAWRGGNLDRIGLSITLLVNALGLIASHVSPGGLYWLFPILMASAFMVGPRLALLLCAGVLVYLLLDGRALARSGQPLAVLSALAVSGVFAAIFAGQSGRRRQQLERLATCDALTGAENRRALEAELERAIAAFRRDGRPVALALVDLDHFKRINDELGHDEGDRVLQAFTRLVQGSVRRTDRLFRYGGEEFVLLMPGTDELGLELAMSHLRSRLREGLRAGGREVTVSIGGAVLRPGEDRDHWFGRADEALYRAKELGRNRVEIDLPPD